ncbi:hypothetical protein GPJ81_10400 [Pseudomonas alkylphenolica]|uniref:Potassium channel domain-containing protein n=1 Tax=Pseudomonas alkylphenolica TaxID=237609 RepID=A0A6I6GRR2_9PSED|nr:pentapeptide repeat-containing protein [Pseudomonas alkylphenolica]QGW77070.1 hypothetical protein GPJ81_10400 [Pseudomonas alkylphenolica]
MENHSKEEPNKEQYALLVSCAIKEDFSAWNDYVSTLDEMIKLRGANFDELTIKSARFKNKHGKGADLYGATFKGSTLESIDLSDTHLMRANFQDATIASCLFCEAACEEAVFENTTFFIVNFTHARCYNANFRNAKFFSSSFYETQFASANLEGARFITEKYNPLAAKKPRLNMCGANFRDTKLNSETYFDLCDVSRNTDFRSISFESANFSAGLRQTLQYCNRRHNWNDWYKKQGALSSILVRLFWMHSDYGRSAKRIISSFFIASLLFATFYFFFPSQVQNLQPWQPIRSLYFSIVTMTTLGFGDMHASPDSWLAPCIIMIQVLYGYVLLGGLITVLSNLFSSDGPALGLVKHPSAPPSFMFTMR